MSLIILFEYGAVTVSAQQLGTDQHCSSSYPCQRICGNHVCAPGEVPGAPQSANKTALNTSNTPSQKANQTMIQNGTASSVPTSMQPLKFSSKGKISNSSGIASGTIVWTILNGNSATFIFHGINGLEVIRLVTMPDPICNNAQNQICLNGTVTNVKDPDQLSLNGTKSKININTIQNQETVGFVTGVLQNMVIQVDLTKTWKYNT